MDRKAGTIGRGVAYGAAITTAPSLLLVIPFLAAAKFTWAIVTLDFALAMGGLPGLATGATLALGTPQRKHLVPWKVRAGLAAGIVFFAENDVLMHFAGSFAVGLLMLFGTPVAALAAGALTWRIV